MLHIQQLIVGTMQTNCLLVWDATSLEALIIDPGDDADFILDHVSRLALTPTLVAATHGHFDHILAATEVSLAYGVPFALSSADHFLLSRFRASAMKYIQFDPGPAPTPSVDLAKLTSIALGEEMLTILKTPGHTPGSVSFYSPTAKFAVVGDTLFEAGGLGRTDFDYSDPKVLDSTVLTIKRLPSGTSIYAGHGRTFEV